MFGGRGHMGGQWVESSETGPSQVQATRGTYFAESLKIITLTKNQSVFLSLLGAGNSQPC